MELKRTQYRLILKGFSSTDIEDHSEIMEAVVCGNHMRKVVYLSSAEYIKQLTDANDIWRHPITNEACWFDDEWFEEYE